MTWDAWGMFAGALEQYNDEEETVVVKSEPEPDSEPPPTVWPEEHPLKLSIGRAWYGIYGAIGARGVQGEAGIGDANFAIMEACPGCGASKLKALYCLHCGHPDMVKCPNGDTACPLCRKHPGWVEELKP
jgi:hypothetical protein